MPLVTLGFGVNLRAVNLGTIRRAASDDFVSKVCPFLKLSPLPQDAISYPKLRQFSESHVWPTTVDLH